MAVFDAIPSAVSVCQLSTGGLKLTQASRTIIHLYMLVVRPAQTEEGVKVSCETRTHWHLASVDL